LDLDKTVLDKTVNSIKRQQNKGTYGHFSLAKTADKKKNEFFLLHTYISRILHLENRHVQSLKIVQEALVLA